MRGWQGLGLAVGLAGGWQGFGLAAGLVRSGGRTLSSASPIPHPMAEGTDAHKEAEDMVRQG